MIQHSSKFSDSPLDLQQQLKSITVSKPFPQVDSLIYAVIGPGEGSVMYFIRKG